jgi:hypothetical protein
MLLPNHGAGNSPPLIAIVGAPKSIEHWFGMMETNMGEHFEAYINSQDALFLACF